MIRTVRLGGLLSVILAALAGCGGGGSAGSCSTSAAGSMQCVDFGAGYTSSNAMQGCVAPSTYSATACTATGRVGRCTVSATAGGATASSTINFYAPVTVDIARMACTAAGAGGATTMFTEN